MKRILVVASHPDDEILGCGGTVAGHVKKGYEAFSLILGEGVTSRDDKRNIKKRAKDIKCLKQDMHKANSFIGVKEVFSHDFPDNRFDKVPLLDIIKVIEKIKNKINPDMVYTHHYGDLNIDHRITYSAVLTAWRPAKGDRLKEIYSFEVPSSTEWNYPCTFKPNMFVDITQTIDKKIQALKVYKTEIREFPHPRSEGAIKITAKRWGTVAGLGYAEAFEVIRIIK